MQSDLNKNMSRIKSTKINVAIKSTPETPIKVCTINRTSVAFCGSIADTNFTLGISTGITGTHRKLYTHFPIITANDMLKIINTVTQKVSLNIRPSPISYFLPEQFSCCLQFLRKVQYLFVFLNFGILTSPLQRPQPFYFPH